jgi:CRISPR/Cas system-associated endonuclease/helicase Cas3
MRVGAPMAVTYGVFASFFISIISQTLRLTRKRGASYRIHESLESVASWIHEQLDDPRITIEDALETLQWAVEETPMPNSGWLQPSAEHRIAVGRTSSCLSQHPWSLGGRCLIIAAIAWNGRAAQR